MDPKEINVTLSPDTKALLSRIAEALEAQARAQQFNADQYAAFVEVTKLRFVWEQRLHERNAAFQQERFAWEQRIHDEVELLNAQRHAEGSRRDNETADALVEAHRMAAAVQREQLRRLQAAAIESVDLQSMIRSAVAEALQKDPK